MKEPIVSVLMTTYNREKYVEEAIRSVLNSTISDFELIVCDDGSKDKTVEIVQKYCVQDSRIRLVLNEINLGDYPNRNKAASFAKGRYLKYVDADDYIYPHGLEVLVKMMESNPSAGLGLCSLIQARVQPYPILLSSEAAYQYHFFTAPIFNKAPLSSIIRRDVFNQVGGFLPDRMVGDAEMWYRLSLKCDVLLMPDGIVWYREHDEQEVNSYIKYVKKYETVKIRALRNPDCPLTADEIKTILRRSKLEIVKNFIKGCLTGNSNLVKEMILRYAAYLKA